MNLKSCFNPAVLGVVVLALCLNTHGAETHSIRVISADLQQVKVPRSMVWQDCVGAGRVVEGLRAGWRRQLETCHRKIGFKYLQMHGLLPDEPGVYSEDHPHPARE